MALPFFGFFRRDLMAIRKPEKGPFPVFVGPLGAHTQRKTSVTHLESTKQIRAFPGDSQIPDFGPGKGPFPDRMDRNYKSTVFLCVKFFGKKLGMWNFSFKIGPQIEIQFSVLLPNKNPVEFI